MRTKHTILAIPLIAVFLLAGCAGSFSVQSDLTTPGSVATEAGPVPVDPRETPAGETPDRSDLRLVETPTPELERVEITPPEPILGEVPAEILAAIIADALERSGAQQDKVQVTRAEAVVWNDGALGCPQPGEMYIQVLINGYWVVLEVNGTVYDYRVSDKGSFKLCNGGGVLPVPPGDPGSGPAPEQ
jgi:hypothetical protein